MKLTFEYFLLWCGTRNTQMTEQWAESIMWPEQASQRVWSCKISNVERILTLKGMSKIVAHDFYFDCGFQRK